MKLHTTVKVFAGFSLAIALIIGVSVITYVSVKNLLESVETLSKPNERLIAYNQLLSEVYKLDQSIQEIATDSAGTSPLLLIKEKLAQLEKRSNDPIEIYKLNGIWYNVEELLEVQNNLHEVKLRVENRDFSKEALDNIERKIRRQEEKRSLENLDRLRSRLSPARSLTNPSENQSASGTENLPIDEPTIEDTEMDRVMDFLESTLGVDDSPNAKQSSQTDSILVALRSYMQELTGEERFLRARLTNLQQQLTRKNRELVLYIQEIIASLQYEAIREGRSENENAYTLTYRLSLFLAGLIILGVVGSAAFIFTITREIRKSEKYNKTLQEAKLKSENLARAKQEFLANMSHEIRNPLHVIQGYQEALAKTDLTAKQREYLTMSGFASETLIGVVNDILDFSKLEAGKIAIEERPFDPHTIFSQAIELFEKSANDKGLKLELMLDFPKECWLMGDSLRINQILNNLLSNAIKFTESGSIQVSAKYLDTEGLIFSVADTGLGMTPSTKEKVFSAFDQGDTAITRRFGGTGLGMSIVRKLLVLMGGQINLESEVGEGSTFTVTIPSKQTAPVKVSNVEESPANLRLDGINILLVDDDKTVRKFTELLLKSLGAEVSAYDGGIDFRDHYQQAYFDIALIDIQMPFFSGYDVLKVLRSHTATKQKPLLALTANVFAKEQNTLVEQGFDGVILKPFKESELLAQLANYITLKYQSEAFPNEAQVSKPTKLYDLDSIRKFSMGDDDMVTELVGDFYVQTEADLKELENSLSKNDFARLRELTHQLSSRLGQFGIQSGKLAKRIEIDLKYGERTQTAKLIQDLQHEIKKVLEQVADDFQLPQTQGYR
ncbi:MAG: response regulator [Lunatimonas sp.]|uniref:hybrid sensor histidine kinase/response regulator n=1 Tax=Lunatimonas sp. TaxID=2060141 RepID=UPI00263A40E1|nr:ATP-binding protein [Lunatimonas sp.]MCC5939511.1 response regulator [Lunatimonas sp.]